MSHAPDTIPDATAPVIAWRCWSAQRHAGAWRLTSPAYGTPWPIGDPCTAMCDIHGHMAPDAGCTCGIWGLQRPGADLIELARVGGAPVLGQIAGWGTTIEGATGWRVAQAYPSVLIVPGFAPLQGGDIPHPAHLAADLDAYGVPVLVMDAAELTHLLRGGMQAIGAHR